MTPIRPRISRIFTVVSFDEFGDIDNPIWHLEAHPIVISKNQLTSKFLEWQDGQVLLPLENLKKDGLDFLKSLPQSARQRLVLQLGLHQLDLLEEVKGFEGLIQVWIDRKISPQHLNQIQELQGQIELVLIPFRLLNVHELYKMVGALKEIPCAFLFIPKLNPFSGLWELNSLYPLYSELSALVPDRHLGSVSLVNVWPQLTPATQNYLLYPTETNYLQLLRSESALQYWLHRLAQPLMPRFLLDLGILSIKILRQPRYFFIWHEGATRRLGVTAFWMIRNNICRLRDFTLQVLLFPIFKVFWFLKFQFEKRVLRVRK